MTYTPPDEGNISFILGDGSLTSPYTEIFAPVPVVDAEVVTDIWLWGTAGQPLSVVACDAITPIMVDGLVGAPSAPAIHSDVFTYQQLDFAIVAPVPILDAEVVTVNIVSGQLESPKGKIDCRMGEEVRIIAPMAMVAAEVVTPTVIYGAVGSKAAILQGDAGVWNIISVAYEGPHAQVYGSTDGGPVAYGNVVAPTPSVAAVINVTITADCAIIQRKAVLTSDVSVPDSYQIIKYEAA